MHIMLCKPTPNLITSLLLLIGLLWHSPAQSEWAVSLYGGLSNTPDADLSVTAPGDTDLTFKSLSWQEKPFEDPPYFGLRLTYWFDRAPNWGMAIDFIHAKVISEKDNAVRVSGRRNGQAIDTVEPLSNTFTTLEFSHGHNLLTANLLYRWQLSPPGRNALFDRLQPYIGAGAGVAIPHVEVDTVDTKTAEYQLAGFAAQGMLGLNIQIMSHLSFFIETKLSYSHIEADLNGGETITVNLSTHHVAFGLTLGQARLN